MKKLLLLLSVVIAGCGGGNSPTTSQTTIATATNSALIPATPTCVPKSYSSTYPVAYLGNYPIPTPTQKFDPNIMRGVGLKDYYPYDNSCGTGSQGARLLYQQTLDRLKLDGVDTVEIYQYGPVIDFNATKWVTDEPTWQIPKSDLMWFFQEAHNKNLKVTLVWQLWPVDSKGNWINTKNPSLAEILKVLNGWNDIITSMAKISNDGHVDNLSVQWGAFYFPILTQYPEESTLAFLKIIDNVRSIYSGKLFMGIPRFYDKRIIQKVDAVVISINPSNWTYNDDVNISTYLIKQRILDAMTGIYLDFSLYSGMNPKDIPVIWDFNIQSRDKALSDGWVEDGFCVKQGGDGAPLRWGSPDCAKQMNYVTDFSVQAIAIEGSFQAIKDQTYFKTYGVNFSTGYWLTDTLIPGPEGFPNLSQSIRGKPAEKIVKYWYSKG
jgi:hypothetical protein